MRKGERVKQSKLDGMLPELSYTLPNIPRRYTVPFALYVNRQPELIPPIVRATAANISIKRFLRNG